MKSKLFFFVVISFLVSVKKSYVYLYDNEINMLNFKNNNNADFDSIKAFGSYKVQVLQTIADNEIKITNLKSAVLMENKIVMDKLEKQLDEIVFKNKQLKTRITSYNLQSIKQFQLFKLNTNLQILEDNQLLFDLIKKHQIILNQSNLIAQENIFK
jgi:hypothetical protein